MRKFKDTIADLIAVATRIADGLRIAKNTYLLQSQGIESMYKQFILTLILTAVLVGSLTADAAEYRLAAGDVVRINVYDHPDLGTTVRLLEDGSISFPLLGTVSLRGMTEREAEARLSNLLEVGAIVISPQVSVIVEQYLGQQVSVLGEVNRPGKYAIDRNGTIVDLISQAGGINDNADDTAIVTSTRQGETKTTTRVLDLTAILRDGDPRQNTVIYGGDTVYVPRMKQFYIYGEVNKPGVYRLEHDMTVMQGLSVAGGLTERGTQRGIRIERRMQNKETESLSAELGDVLQPNDVVFVSESFF